MLPPVHTILFHSRRMLIAVLSAAALTGCASHYVDTSLKDVPQEQFKQVVNPRPVQLLVEFQTKGSTNAAATNYVKPLVSELVTKTGLFSKVGTEPDSNGGVLSIVINNVALTDDAYSQGFVTGLTFGMAGSAVTDGYIGNIEYLPGTNSPKIAKTVRHAIHTTLGAKDAPQNAIKTNSIDEAMQIMLRQLVSNGLYELSSDPSFK